MKKTMIILSVVLLVGLIGTIVAKFYPYIFAREVKGTIVGVTKVNPQSTIIGSGGSISDVQMFSFAVAIKDANDGEIVTGSSEDRQWAVAKEGLCADAKFFPYPPWQLSNADTYFNVRLIKLYDCPGSSAAVGTAPSVAPAIPAGPAASPSPPTAMPAPAPSTAPARTR